MADKSIPSPFSGYSFPRSLAEFPEHAALIADIIVLWNLLEDKCVYLLQSFSGIDGEQGDLMLSCLSSPGAKMEAVLAAGKWSFSMFPKELEELESFFKSVTDRLLKRNKYAHGVYMVNEKGELGLLFRKFTWNQKEKRFIPLRTHELKDEKSAYIKLLSRVAEIEKSAYGILSEEIVLSSTEILLKRRALRPSGQE